MWADILEPQRNALYHLTGEVAEVLKPGVIAQGTQLVGSQAQSKSQGVSAQRMLEQPGRSESFHPTHSPSESQAMCGEDLAFPQGIQQQVCKPSRRCKNTQRGKHRVGEAQGVGPAEPLPYFILLIGVTHEL